MLLDTAARYQEPSTKYFKVAVGELEKGIHSRMQEEIQGILANMVGRNTENNVTAILERLVGTRPGLLLNGFNVRENLKLFFDAFNIKLKAYAGKSANGKS